MAPVHDGSQDAVIRSIDQESIRAPGVVPSLHQLCCDFIMNVVINLDNVLSIVDFARSLNIKRLEERALRFVTSSWKGMIEKHSPAELEAGLGSELYTALSRDHEQSLRHLKFFRQTGSVIDQPEQPSVTRQPPAHRPSTQESGAAPEAAPLTPATTTTTATAPQRAPLSAAAIAARRRFSGTGGGEKCVACGKTVYQAERVAGHKLCYHVSCFRCKTCGVRLGPHSFEQDADGTLYCKPHFAQREYRS